MKLLLLILLIPFLLHSTVVYVDATLGADITNGSYSVANRDNSGSAGNAYDTFVEAIGALTASDTLYLRGGTYTASSAMSAYAVWQLSYLDNGTAQEPTLVASYPGEWAILDGNGQCTTYATVLGYMSTDHFGLNDYSYWVIERLEITGGNDDGNGRASGIWMSGNNLSFRYLYIHDNVSASTDVGNNPSGLRGSNWQNNLVEYCYFKNNGLTTQVNQHNVAHLAPFAEYYTGTRENWVLNVGGRVPHIANEFRYNYFESDGTTSIAIKHKGHQFLTPSSSDLTYKNYGDKWHHNIIVGSYSMGVDIFQDFCQVYNNIIEVPENTASLSYVTEICSECTQKYFLCFYNNTIIRGSILLQNNATGNDTIYNTIQNNLITAFDNTDPPNSLGWWAYSINIMARYGDSRSVEDVIWNSDYPIQNNFIHSPAQSDHYEVGSDGGADCGHTTTEFDARFGSTNYSNSTADLFLSASGSRRFIPDSNFVVGGSTTIADGGSGAAHPFLDGVTLPGYVGAVSPSDTLWTFGVQDSITDTTFLKAQSGVDEQSWVEGGSITDDTSPTYTPKLTLNGTDSTDISIVSISADVDTLWVAYPDSNTLIQTQYDNTNYTATKVLATGYNWSYLYVRAKDDSANVNWYKTNYDSIRYIAPLTRLKHILEIIGIE